MSRRFDVSLRTLRFYEARGLLSPRRESTARYYSKQDAVKLESILRCKRLGFTLTEIQGMMASSPDQPGRERF